MAAPCSSGVRAPTDWRRRVVGASLIAIGICGVGAAGWVYYDAWSTRRTYDASPEAAAVARQQVEPTPIWIAPATPQPVAIQPIPPPSAPASAPFVPIVSPRTIETASSEELSLDSTDFRFLDPPEPGAHARLAIWVANHGHAPSGRIFLAIDASWFDSYSIVGTAPAVASDRTDENGLRMFSFPPVSPGTTVTYELHVTSKEEGTRAPSLQILAENREPIGSADKLATFAPQPRPGPVMAIDIPRLKLHSSVVQTVWEPPPFNVGQIKGTANVTLGNTVLIGHLTGAAGNVFAHLDELQTGDEVTAMSRGLPYKFVVSQSFSGANTDAAPMEPADDARLTLMTCAGIWNPFTHDYSERLWVIAEPPDQAAVTIANAQATATVVAAATATAVAAEPTETPTAVPTPYAGEPSLAGGVGNTRRDLEQAFGMATGETEGKLVVFRPSGREVRVRFSPDPPRARLVAVFLNTPLPFDAAVRESRRLFPSDTRPRVDAPEGNSTLVVERFTSMMLGEALGTADFSVIYAREPNGLISAITLGPGDDIDALVTESRR